MWNEVMPKSYKAISGSWVFQFRDEFRSTRTITYGKIPRKIAESHDIWINRLIVAKISGTAIDTQTAAWIASLSDVMREKLSRVGLTTSINRDSMSGFLDDFIKRRKPEMADNTIRNYRQTKAKMESYFGEDRDLRNVSAGDAENYRFWLLHDCNLSEATVAREIKRARQIFKQAMKHKIVAENPFLDVKSGSQVNEERTVYIYPEDVEKCIQAAPCADWRLIIALGRYAGLRLPSEVIGSLRWDDILWDQNKMIIYSRKQKKHLDRKKRIIPIFPEVREHLENLFHHPAKGAESEFIITRYTNPKQNLGTTFEKIVLRAGVQPWPRLLHNLRASCVTDAMDVLSG